MNENLQLNAWDLSYDPDLIESKDHLIFAWECQKLSQNSNISCPGDEWISYQHYQSIANISHNAWSDMVHGTIVYLYVFNGFCSLLTFHSF